MKDGKHNKWTLNVAEKSLEMVRQDLFTTLPHLGKLLYITKEQEQDLPVAFATNALYVLERNGCGNKEEYERVLIPILKNKIDYLHTEGVAQAVWALSNAEIWDT